MNKTLGIIGGMGPLATAQLYEMITLHTKVKKEQDHLHIIIDSAPFIPDRTEYILEGGENPGPYIEKSARRLKAVGCDCLIMPCNTAHYFKDHITKVNQNGFLDMIEITANYIEEHFSEVKEIVLMATKGVYVGKVYEDVFKNHNLKIITPSNDEQTIIMNLIYSIKLGNTDYLKEYNDLLDNYINKGLHYFIAGCTELSVANERFDLHGYQIDPLMCLTEKVIEHFDRTFEY